MFNKSEIMKKIFSIALFLFMVSGLAAQTVTHKNSDDLNALLLDSVKYVQPEFAAGRVIFKNGEQSNGAINISTVDQKVHFIDPNGKILVISNNDEVSKVLIKGRTFMNSRYGYIELHDLNGDILFGELRRVTFLEEEKTGAFGSKSQTTAITSINSVNAGGYMVDLSQYRNTPYMYKKVPYLCRKGLFYIASKKIMQRCFPSKKEFIETYCKENDVNFSNVEEVRALFNALK